MAKPLTPQMKRIQEEKRKRLNTPIPEDKKDRTLLDRFRAEEFFEELNRRKQGG